MKKEDPILANAEINKMMVGMIQKKLPKKKISGCSKRSVQGRKSQNDTKAAFKEENI